MEEVQAISALLVRHVFTFGTVLTETRWSESEGKAQSDGMITCNKTCKFAKLQATFITVMHREPAARTTVIGYLKSIKGSADS